MNLANRAVAFIVGSALTAIFIFSYLEYLSLFKPDPWIKININNQSSSNVVRLIVRSQGNELVHGGINSLSELTLPFPMSHDGNYKIEFILDDGKVCESVYGYVVPGMMTTELITDIGVSNGLNKSPQQCV